MRNLTARAYWPLRRASAPNSRQRSACSLFTFYCIDMIGSGEKQNVVILFCESFVRSFVCCKNPTLLESDRKAIGIYLLQMQIWYIHVQVSVSPPC